MEDAIGVKFSDATARVIGNRTSVVKGVPYKGAKARKEMIEKIGAKLEPIGFNRHAGRTSKETVWSSKDAVHVVRAQDRGVQMLIECITTKD